MIYLYYEILYIGNKQPWLPAATWLDCICSQEVGHRLHSV